MDYLLATLLLLTGIFMILLVLIQRGRGGGLAGAFGGAGGQSAFGTKAGDVFTKITVVVACIWVLLAGGSILAFRGDEIIEGADATAGDPKLESLNTDDAKSETGTQTDDNPTGTDSPTTSDDASKTDTDAKPIE